MPAEGEAYGVEATIYIMRWTNSLKVYIGATGNYPKRIDGHLETLLFERHHNCLVTAEYRLHEKFRRRSA